MSARAAALVALELELAELRRRGRFPGEVELELARLRRLARWQTINERGAKQ